MSETGYLLDASAALALLYRESGADQVEAVLPEASISAVNLSEVVSKLHDRKVSSQDIALSLADLDLSVEAFDERVALQAAALRPDTRHAGLSLGDRACLATASETGRIVLTADKAWATLDLGISIQVIR